MLALGVILILLSAGALVAVLANGTADQAQIFGGDLPTLVIFLAGAAALLLFIMGLELLRSGLRRANTNRKTKKKLRRLEEREDSRHNTVVGAGGEDSAGSTSGTSSRGTSSTDTSSTGGTGSTSGTGGSASTGTSSTDPGTSGR